MGSVAGVRACAYIVMCVRVHACIARLLDKEERGDGLGGRVAPRLSQSPRRLRLHTQLVERLLVGRAPRLEGSARLRG